MNMLFIRHDRLVLPALVILSGCATKNVKDTRTNIIFILAGDLGYLQVNPSII